MHDRTDIGKEMEKPRILNDEGWQSSKDGSFEIRHLVIKSDFVIRISSLRRTAADFLIEHSYRALVHGLRILV